MWRIRRSISTSPRSSSRCSSSKETSKWSSIARFWLDVTMMTCSIPAATASSTAYWMTGLSTSGSISLGCAFVAGKEPGAPSGGWEDGFADAHRTSIRRGGGSTEYTSGSLRGRP